MHTTVLGVTPSRNRASERLRQSEQPPMVIFKPAERLVVLSILLCLCWHPRAREADDGLGVEGLHPPSHGDCPTALCQPTAARPGNTPVDSIPAPAVPTFPCLLQELPVLAPHQLPSLTLYMETFTVACAAEEFEQLTIAISEITFVVLGSQNKPYLLNWFTVFHFFLEEKGKAVPILYYSALKLLVWWPQDLCSSHGFVTF